MPVIHIPVGKNRMGKNQNKQKIRKIVRWICWVFVIQFVLINISAAFYAYRLTHFYDDPSLREPNPSRNIFSKTWRLFTGPKYPRSQVLYFPEFQYETVKLKTGNEISIEAWYSKPGSVSNGTVIMFHGIGGAKDYLLDEAEEFLNMDYNVMLVDFRGHGNSSGNTTTIGIKESEEVKLAVGYVQQRGEKRIFLWGGSMGAVVVAKAVGEYDLQVSGIILEAPFASIQSHLKARARILDFPRQPFAFFTTFWIGVERGFNGFNAQTCRYAKKINCPVLVQWGSLDAYVLKWEIDSVFHAISSADKKLVIYNDGFHESLLRRNPSKWRSEIEEFLIGK